MPERSEGGGLRSLKRLHYFHQILSDLRQMLMRKQLINRDIVAPVAEMRRLSRLLSCPGGSCYRCDMDLVIYKSTNGKLNGGCINIYGTVINLIRCCGSNTNLLLINSKICYFCCRCCFVCVKGYSLDDTIPFLEKITDEHTVVIPILNIYGTGQKLQKKLPKTFVTDGCIYIAAEIKCPGTILMSGKIFRVVYGLRKDTPADISEKVMPILEQVEKDLADSGITPLLSDFIEKDALQKFSFVSPMAALGAGYDIPSAAVQTEGELRDTFKALIKEVKALSVAMEAPLPDNIVEINLKIIDDLVPTATASMQRDIKAGKQSEVDGLVYQVVRYGEQYQVPTPVYAKLAAMLHAQLD